MFSVGPMFVNAVWFLKLQTVELGKSVINQAVPRNDGVNITSFSVAKTGSWHFRQDIQRRLAASPAVHARTLKFAALSA